MALTKAQEKRLSNLEVMFAQLNHLIQGAGSKNQLNRLLVLAQEDIRKLDEKVTEVEESMDELLELVRKLQ